MESNWNLKLLIFDEKVLREKPLGAGTRTSDKLRPFMMPCPGIELDPLKYIGSEGSYYCTMPASPNGRDEILVSLLSY